MAKKQNSKKLEEVVSEVEVQEVKEEKLAQTEPTKQTAKQVDSSKQKKQKKDKKEKGRLKRRLKETGSELKKVTWPSFRKVVKQTGIVIAMVVIFTVVLFGFDKLLELLFNLLV